MTGGSCRLNTVLDVQGQKTSTNTGFTSSVTPNLSRAQSLPFGTGSGTASISALVSLGLAPGATSTIDLYDGSVLDVFEDAAAFRVLRSFAFWVASGGDTAGVTITGGASNPHGLWWEGTPGTSTGQTVYPDGPAAQGGSPAGEAVTSSAKTLLVTNNSAVFASCYLFLAGSAAVTGVAMGVLGLTYP